MLVRRFFQTTKVNLRLFYTTLENFTSLQRARLRMELFKPAYLPLAQERVKT